MIIVCLKSYWNRIELVTRPGYNQRRDFEMLTQEMSRNETGGRQANRLFYLALPPSVFAHVTTQLKETCMSASGKTL